MRFGQVIWFLLPSLAGLGIFYIIPFVSSRYCAFMRSDAWGGWAELDNFRGMNFFSLIAIYKALYFH